MVHYNDLKKGIVVVYWLVTDVLLSVTLIDVFVLPRYVHRLSIAFNILYMDVIWLGYHDTNSQHDTTLKLM